MRTFFFFFYKPLGVYSSKLAKPPWKTLSSMEFLRKLKTTQPYDSAIPLLGIYPKKTKILTQKCIHTPMFTAALFTITEIWK